MLVYFDCYAGAAGDMIVASLVDAGADAEALKAELVKLQLDCRLEFRPVRRGALRGLQFCVEAAGDEHSHRGLEDIMEIIRSAKLSQTVTDNAEKIFRRLAEAEAKVHGIEIEKVHFHEVGAVDSIIDVVAACVALELLEVEKVLCSPVPMGSGEIDTAHGRMPLPSPATAELLAAADGAKVVAAETAGEATTPTAAAILTTLAGSFGPMPAMQPKAVGWGAGTRENQDGSRANMLRVFLGREDAEGEADSVVELSANLDDCTGEIIGATIEQLLSAGCLDAWATPAMGKKSRPAWILSALCSPAEAGEAERIIFTQTTTFGIRRRTCRRSKLTRRHKTVETAYGPIRIKVGSRGGREITASAEIADCTAAAESHGVAVMEVMAAAMSAYRTGGQGEGR